MLHHVNAQGVIDPASEMHYRSHRRIDPAVYPQVHDFYELTLVTEGRMFLDVNGCELVLERGSLVLLRPGDIHSRQGDVDHINVAFPTRVIGDMFRYLDDESGHRAIVRGKTPPAARLTDEQTTALQDRLERLNLLPEQSRMVFMQLRRVMLDVVMEYILPTLQKEDGPACPRWLEELCRQLEEPEVFSGDLSALAARSGYTKEHLCRSFRKYLGMSPTAYLNAKRLNYAANLLLHTDRKVIDIAYASGFQSLSRFYHAFKGRYLVSPVEYREGRPVRL